jgi:hypothetical protein
MSPHGRQEWVPVALDQPVCVLKQGLQGSRPSRKSAGRRVFAGSKARRGRGGFKVGTMWLVDEEEEREESCNQGLTASSATLPLLPLRPVPALPFSFYLTFVIVCLHAHSRVPILSRLQAGRHGRCCSPYAASDHHPHVWRHSAFCPSFPPSHAQIPPARKIQICYCPLHLFLLPCSPSSLQACGEAILRPSRCEFPRTDRRRPPFWHLDICPSLPPDLPPFLVRSHLRPGGKQEGERYIGGEGLELGNLLREEGREGGWEGRRKDRRDGRRKRMNEDIFQMEHSQEYGNSL